MNTQYTHKQLSEIITSDNDVESLKQTIIRDNTKSINNYYLIQLLILISVIGIGYFIMHYYDDNIAPTILTCLSIVFMVIFGIVSNKQNIHNKNIEYIEYASISIKISERCSEVEKMVSTQTEAANIQALALQNGRQLYNFDADLMQELVASKMKELAQQHEQEACKKVHGLQLI